MQLVRRRSKKIEGFLLALLTIVPPLWATMRTVSIDVDSVPGSLRYVIDSASNGDTVMFDCSGTDTVKVNGPLVFLRNIVIIGKNASMRSNIILQATGGFGICRINGGNVALKRIAISGYYLGTDTGGIARVNGDAAALTLDSVIISQGSAQCGGGIYIRSGSVHLNNSRIFNCRGGAIVNDSGHLFITKSVLSKNSNSSGGAIVSRNGSVEMTNDSLSGNTANDYGGGIALYGGSLTIEHCAISGNYSSAGGGGIYVGTGTLEGTGTILTNNYTIKGPGGAILIAQGNVTLTSCDILNSSSPVSGGGIYNESGQLTLVNGSIKNDTAGYAYDSKSTPAFHSSPSASCGGGGIYNKNGGISLVGVMLINNMSSVYAPNIINAGNELVDFSYSSYGGGIYQGSGHCVIENSTIAGNTSMTSATTGSSIVGIYSRAYGGGVFNDNGHVSILNSTFFKNVVSAYAYTLSWSSKHEIIAGGALYNAGGPIRVQYATITGNTGGIRSESGLCRVLNSIIVDNSSSDFFSNDTSLCVHTFIGSGTPVHAVHCSVGVAAVNIFSLATPVLENHGGPTQTISLGSSSSLAMGAGVRAATYFQDTGISDKTVPVLKMAYFDSNLGDWRSLDDTARIPAGTEIHETIKDQRGITRPAPPCIGAFEFTSSDPIRQKTPTVTHVPQINFVRNSLYFRTSDEFVAKIELVNLMGRLLASKKVKIVSGTTVIQMEKWARGPLVCRMSMPSGNKVRKINLFN